MAQAQMKPDPVLDAAHDDLESACPWCGYASAELEKLGVLHVVSCDACERIHSHAIEPFVLTLVDEDDGDDEWPEEETAEYEVPHHVRALRAG